MEELGLWWGTIEGAGILPLIEWARATGFGSISVTPAMYFDARAEGMGNDGLRDALRAAGIRVAMIDPLIRGLPGAPNPTSMARRFRSTFEHGEDDCWTAATALGAPMLNLAHYQCAPASVAELAEAVGAIADHGLAHNCDVLVEFMPEGSIGDLVVAADVIARANRPNVGLMLDTWHFFRTGGELAQLEALARGVIRALQLSDAPESFRGSGLHPPSPDRLMPGEGAIPLREIVKIARVNNASVVIGAEVFDRSGEPALPRAKRAYEAVLRLL